MVRSMKSRLRQYPGCGASVVPKFAFTESPFPTMTRTGRVLPLFFHPASWLLLLMIVSATGCQLISKKGNPSVLTTINQIRNLDPDEADRSYPVRVRGVVTYFLPWNTLIVQDSSSGIL